ncbi:MAG: nicotinate-nucleotide adenylyltransferase [Candidatus Omnitrophota bacterium]|jgi:nicotinate-nucleotide adenylyltransferase|nr:MAG: nicotinate-nucleotide adenylyltransferase [Candidatus Omnitrophota bacterium]
MKIGILGGTFNPIHLGHLILAEEVREQMNLEKIIFVPTFLAPHKDNSNVASAKDRHEMITLAIRGNRHFSVSDIEIARKGRSYTIDTLKELVRRFSSDELSFITGSDLLNYLDEWKDLQDIIKLVRFIVATRPGYPLEKIPSYIDTVEIRAVDISAFEIRKRIQQRQSFRYLVPEAVYAYIARKRLYS